MWNFVQELNGQALFRNQVIETEQGIRARIRSVGDKKASAVASLSHTKFNFYSKSAAVCMLIEMSQEMFDFDEVSNFMQVEKCIHFVRAYLERCKHESASHELSIILYARLYYP